MTKVLFESIKNETTTAYDAEEQTHNLSILVHQISI
jgi:hypothetical protein